MGRIKGSKNKVKSPLSGEFASPTDNTYRASITIMGQSYSGEGQTISEALFQLNPKMARGVAVLTVQKGEKKRERILNRLMTARLFSPSRMMREVATLRTSALFDV